MALDGEDRRLLAVLGELPVDDEESTRWELGVEVEGPRDAHAGDDFNEGGQEWSVRAHDKWPRVEEEFAHTSRRPLGVVVEGLLAQCWLEAHVGVEGLGVSAHGLDATGGIGGVDTPDAVGGQHRHEFLSLRTSLARERAIRIHLAVPVGSLHRLGMPQQDERTARRQGYRLTGKIGVAGVGEPGGRLLSREPLDRLNLVVGSEALLGSDSRSPVVDHLGQAQGDVLLAHEWGPEDRHDPRLLVAFAYSRHDRVLAGLELALG